MEQHAQDTSQARRGAFFCAFRPLLVWLPVAAVLIGGDIHRRRLAHTHLFFKVSVDGRHVSDGYRATLDGRPVGSGQRVGPGQATLRIIAPDVELWEKAVRLRYGTNDLGEIHLVSHRGTLVFDADPPPLAVAVDGGRFTAASTNAPARFEDLPVGEYRVSVVYPWQRIQGNVRVTRGETTNAILRADVGSLHLAATPPDAAFALTSLHGFQVSTNGQTPMWLQHLPAGPYRLRIWRGEYLKETNVQIESRAEQRLTISFEYGRAEIITDPPGATVFFDKGTLGPTPTVLEGLTPGRYRMRLDRTDYRSATVEFSVVGGESVSIRTNLVRLASRPPVSVAAPTPTPPVAATGVGVQAESPISGTGETVGAAELVGGPEPAHQEKPLPVPPAESGRERKTAAIVERFAKATKDITHADLFDTYSWTIRVPIDRASPAIRRALETGPGKWTVEREIRLEEEGSQFEGTGKRGLLGGPRKCFVMAYPVSQDEVLVQAKFWEYVVVGSARREFRRHALDGLWIPLHATYVETIAPHEITQRRRAAAETFWAALQSALK